MKRATAWSRKSGRGRRGGFFGRQLERRRGRVEREAVAEGFASARAAAGSAPKAARARRRLEWVTVSAGLEFKGER